MSPTIRFLLASTLLTHAACATDTTAPPSDDKDPYRDSDGKSDNGVDVCEYFDWYGDGECDSFCVQRDSDCATDARMPELASPADALASNISMADACARSRVLPMAAPSLMSRRTTSPSSFWAAQ